MPSSDDMSKNLYKKFLTELKALWKKLGLAVFRIYSKRFGGYIHIGATKWRLVHHPADFSILSRCSEIESQLSASPDFAGVQVRRLSTGMCRISVVPKQVDQVAERVDQLMDKLRPRNVLHHIYQVQDTRSEIVITDQLYLTLRTDDPQTLDEICKKYDLLPVGRMGRAHIVKVTTDSGVNPLKLANQIAGRRDVEFCAPQTLLPVAPSDAPAAGLLEPDDLAARHHLFKHQWNLNMEPSPTLPGTPGLNLSEAWRLVSKQKKFEQSDVVIAVIDDGFDLKHRAFLKTAFLKTKKGEVIDFIGNDDDPIFETNNHGTKVASLLAANGDQLIGVAPTCRLLPIRLDTHSAIHPETLVAALRIASEHADVVSCSFNNIPEELDRLEGLHPPLKEEIASMIESGGLHKNGLVIVFSAGNHDAPIVLSKEENKNGVKFWNGREPDEVAAGKPIHSLYPEIPNIVVVGAMSSLKRKAGYSNWGRKLTVTAPSSNSHDLFDTHKVQLPEFKANYEGNSILAAVGGAAKMETPYLENFGGTSAAAPMVSGVIALIRSVNPRLKPAEIIEILQKTADRSLNAAKLDLSNDPNLQGLSVEFDGDNHSIIFGAGKVDAAAAVQEAINRLPPEERL